MGFFDDILIPHSVLQHPSRFEEAEQAWVWEYPVEDGSKHDLYMDIGETIKFRVQKEEFEETSPVGVPNADPAVQANSVVKTPYLIHVSRAEKQKQHSLGINSCLCLISGLN